jgi:hypothetical protein
MSAWAELVNANGSDEWLEMCSRALLEVQRETSRRNAAKIRAAYEGRGTDEDNWITNPYDAADLIDPEESQ